MTTLTTKKVTKKASYELIFFAVIVAAWAALTLFFNLAQRELQPTDAKNATAATSSAAEGKTR